MQVIISEDVLTLIILHWYSLPTQMPKTYTYNLKG